MSRFFRSIFHPEIPTEDERRERRRRFRDRLEARASRFWLALLTALWIWVSLTLTHQQDVANGDRVDGIQQRCDLVRTINNTAHRLGVPADAEELQDLHELELRCLQSLAEAKAKR